MFYVKLSELLKYAGMIGSGVVVGALVGGAIIQLPMLIEAKWGEETREIRFENRMMNVCDVEEIATEGFEESELLEQ